MMRILIVDHNHNIRRFIPGSSIAQIEFIDHAGKIQFSRDCLISNASPCFYAVEASRARLLHAVETGADVAYLHESQFLTENQFRDYQYPEQIKTRVIAAAAAVNDNQQLQSTTNKLLPG